MCGKGGMEGWRDRAYYVSVQFALFEIPSSYLSSRRRGIFSWAFFLLVEGVGGVPLRDVLFFCFFLVDWHRLGRGKMRENDR